MEEKLMDFITIFNLMKQAPEFSMFGIAVVSYLVIFFIKTKGRDEVTKIMKPLADNQIQINNKILEMDKRFCRIEKKLNITGDGL
jgi:hypothetical protein